METKKCSRCKKNKSFGEFYKNKSKKDGLSFQCKNCIKEYAKKFREENRETLKEKGNEYRKENREKVNEHQRNYVKRHKEKVQSRLKTYRESNKESNKEYYKEYAKNNKEKIIENQQRYKSLNKEKIKEYHREYIKERCKTDVNFHLLINLRSRMRTAIKDGVGFKDGNAKELLGCNIETVREHLEKQFTEGMSWDNYGEWHIDHIRPCASFDMTDPKQQRECFHWTNLQPLWAEENMSKGAKILKKKIDK